MSSRHAAGVSALALGAAAVAVGVISTSDHTDSRLALGVLAVGTSLAFITAGLVARLRRPENRIGGLMVVTGFSWMLGALTTADNATVFTIGMVVGAIAFGFLAHLMLAYPWGRLEERVDRAIIGAVYVLMTVGQLAVVLVSDPGDLGCTRDCPDNRLQAVGDGALSTAVQAAWQVAAIALALAGIARLGTRWRHATPALRRTLAPVYATSALLLAVVAASVVIAQLYGQGPFDWLVLSGMLLVPVGFLVGVLRARLARSGLTRLLVELPEEAPLAEAEAALQRALADPSARLAYWLPEAGGYVDVDGKPFELPAETATCVTTRIDYDDRPVAALVHDAALRDEPGLLEEAAALIRIGLEKDRGMRALRASEARTRALLDALPDLMFRIARDGTYLDYKAPSERDLYAPEVVGLKVHDRLPREVADQIMENGCRALADGEVHTVEYSLPFEGRLRHYEGRLVASGDDEFLFIVREITARKEAQEQLQRERDLVRTIVNTAPTLFCGVEPDGRIVRFNQALERLSGRVDDGDARGRRFWDVFVAPENREHFARAFREDAAERRAAEHEHDWLTASGEHAVVAWSANWYPGEQGADRFLITGTDITERKRHEQQLRRQHDFLNAIANYAPSLLCLVEANGHVAPRASNKAFERTLGYEPDEIGGQVFWEAFVAPEDATDARRALERAAAGEPPREQDNRWLTKDGRRIVVAWSCTALPAIDERRLYLVFGADVTERRRAFEEVRRLAEEQAALRRVATLVAAEPSEHELMEAVAREVALLFEADGANVGRFEGEGLRVVGGWSRPGSRAMVYGALVPTDRSTLSGLVRRTGRPARLNRYADVDDVPDVVRATGARTGVGAPIEVDGELWGAMIVTRATDDPFPDGAEERLWHFAALVAQAISNAEARASLRASRARIVEAGDRERRRLERNLHDGAQQRLVALTLALRLAETKLRTDPELAAAQLATARAETAQALEELRELARGLHPAVLTERGLDAALETLAARSPVPVGLETPGERLPEPVEAAAYYVVSEALANVAKYAQASEVSVRVAQDNGYAVVEVADDGVGGADPAHGSGLSGLADRIAALDGRLRVDSEAGRGTRIRAEIPVAERVGGPR